MEILELSKLSNDDTLSALQRPVLTQGEDLEIKVKEIIMKVKVEGDRGALDLTAQIDGVKLDDLQVSPEEMLAADKLVSDGDRQAIVNAIKNVSRFHSAQVPQKISVETRPGVVCRQEFRPIERVGLYVPGGTAPLVSTVIMLAVPAGLAGCPDKILCTPPDKNGKVNPHILVAARYTGITKVYKIGGAQAVAAMAFGTESIPAVDKIFGPGNTWVTEAKKQVSQAIGGPTCDMPAGPSEVLVIADKKAKASFIAADLLSQAEHGPDSQVILLTESRALAEEVKEAVITQCEELPRRDVALGSLSNSKILICESLDQAFKISNQYGPEHLILQLEDAESYCQKVINAGSVFVGKWTPESVGDYASGTNHVLPTYGYTKSVSGLSVESFGKKISFQSLSFAGLQDIGPTVERLASIEGLEAHRKAVSLRLTGPDSQESI